MVDASRSIRLKGLLTPSSLAALVVVLASALAVVVLARPSADEPGDSTTVAGPTAPVQARVPQLSANQVEAARKAASADPTLKALLKDTATKDPIVGVWHFTGGELLGAVVVFDLQAPARISGEWLTFDFRAFDAESDKLPPSLRYTATYTGVDSISVSVRLPELTVVKIEPHGVSSDLSLEGTVPPELESQPTGTPSAD